MANETKRDEVIFPCQLDDGHGSVINRYNICAIRLQLYLTRHVRIIFR